MTETFQTTQAAELESLAVFRELIRRACQIQPAIDDEMCYDLQLAVDEACTNIITHGYAGMNPGSIILQLEVEADRVYVTLTDFGHAFEPSQAPQPDITAELEDRPMGGFGLYFIYQTMDRVDYATGADCNRLFLMKRISPHG